MNGQRISVWMVEISGRAFPDQAQSGNGNWGKRKNSYGDFDVVDANISSRRASFVSMRFVRLIRFQASLIFSNHAAAETVLAVGVMAVKREIA